MESSSPEGVEPSSQNGVEPSSQNGAEPSSQKGAEPSTDDGDEEELHSENQESGASVSPSSSHSDGDCKKRFPLKRTSFYGAAVLIGAPIILYILVKFTQPAENKSTAESGWKKLLFNHLHSICGTTRHHCS